MTTEATHILAPDELEAKVRIRMAAITKARGWDSGRERAGELAEIDGLLDAYNALATCRTCGLSRVRCEAVRGCCPLCRHE